MTQRRIKDYSSFVLENLQEESKFSSLAGRISSAIQGISKGVKDWFITRLRAQKENPSSATHGGKIFYYPSQQDVSNGAPSVAIRGGEAEVDEAKKNVAIDTDVDPLQHLDFPLYNGKDTGVKNVGYDRLYKEIKKSFTTLGSETESFPLMIWGAPGIGKTTIVKAVAKALNPDMRMIDLTLSSWQPDDFFLPSKKTSVEGDGQVTERIARIPIEDLPLYHRSQGKAGDDAANGGPNGAGGILFLDELSRTKGAVRNICLKLINERMLSQDWILGSKWVVIAASNRTEDDPTNDAEFGSALANRFRQVNYSPRFKDFEPYMSTKTVSSGEKLFDPLILAFLSWPKGQEYLHKYAEGTLVFPTPRSWEAAAREWHNLKKEAEQDGREIDLEDLEMALSTTVGTEAAGEFMDFYRTSQKMDLVGLPKVWTDPMNAPVVPKNRNGDYDLDLSYIAAVTIAYAKRGQEISVQDFSNLIDYVVRLDNPTIAQQILQAVIDTRPMVDGKRWIESESFKQHAMSMFKFVKKYPGYERELGITNVNAPK